MSGFKWLSGALASTDYCFAGSLYFNMEKFSISVVRGLEGLVSIRDLWRTLALNNSTLLFSASYAWYFSRLSTQEEQADSVYFIVITDDVDCLAIVPVQYGPERMWGLNLPAFSLYWPSDMRLSGVAVAERLPVNLLMPLVLKALNSKISKPWHLFAIRDIAEDSPLVAGDALSRHISYRWNTSKYLRLGENYEQSMQAVSGKFQRNLRRKQRNLEKLGQVAYEFVNDAQAIEQAVESFFEVEAAGWKGESGSRTAIRFYPDQLAFYRQLVRQAVIDGQCEIQLMTLNGEVIAGQLSMPCGDTLYLLKIGFDDRFKEHGPGGGLLNETIARYSGHDTIRKISFITGATWNDSWNPSELPVFYHYLFNATVRGLLCYMLERGKHVGRLIKHRFFVQQ